MNKLTLSVCVTRTIVVSLLTSLFLPLPSRGSEQKFYSNCAELQRVINDRNPGLTVKGFEKVRMMRRDLTGYADHAAGDYILLCNGGILIDRGERTICRGYIGYSYEPHISRADYYARWGKANGSSNLNDTDQDRYCRRIK